MRVIPQNDTIRRRSVTAKLACVGLIGMSAGLFLPLEQVAERDVAHAALRDAYVWVACIDAGVIDHDLDASAVGASVARHIDQAFLQRTGRLAAELTILTPSDYRKLGKSLVAAAAPESRGSICAEAKAHALSVMRAVPGVACPRSSCA